jgi:hypothetical protein
MSKCTENCFVSLKEKEMLPTEEKCMYNCIIKSLDFQEFADNKLAYALRNMDSIRSTRY